MSCYLARRGVKLTMWFDRDNRSDDRRGTTANHLVLHKQEGAAPELKWSTGGLKVSANTVKPEH